MKRRISAALACATAVLFATAALAESPSTRSESNQSGARTQTERPRYANTAERWRGLPSLRSAASMHPAVATGSEKVYEHLPSVNFCLEGQHGGAFAVPRF